MVSKSSISNARARRALRIIRALAVRHGYQVGGHGGTEIDELFELLESALENDEPILVDRPGGWRKPDSG